ncbi:MAG: HYR domain-containing protein, partial [Acidobacteriota bacterium]
NLGGASFIVTVVDTTKPTLSASDITVSASNAAGVAVNYAPIGHDLVSGDVASVCSPTSGTVFTIGSHPVSCAATDGAGNVSTTATFTVTVLDGVAPVVTVPAAVTAEATSATGATVTFSATASDNVDETLTTTCTPASGSAFPLGNTLVTCTATDSGGNTGTASFTVSVVDTTAPTLSLPTIAPVVSMTPTVVLTYTVTASDIVDGGVVATCSPASGSAFPVGNTLVTCTVADSRGNTATGSFTIKVNDGVSPIVTVNPAGNRTVEATSSAGATVTFSATATDNRDGARPVTCSPASGTVFPIGPATVVTCSATDADGNVGTTTFTVTVVDTTPPALTLPAPITQTTNLSGGVAVTYSASALDIVSGSVPVTCAPASGATFPVGLTTVNCSTSDARGNASTGSFTVTVTLLQNGIERFVAFSKDSTRLRSEVTVVSGDVGANERRTNTTHGHRREGDDGDRDDVTVQFGEKSVMQSSTSRVVGDTVSLMSKAKVYNVTENVLINKEASVLGTITRPMTIPYLTMPAAPTMVAGTTAFTVKKNT